MSGFEYIQFLTEKLTTRLNATGQSTKPKPSDKDQIIQEQSPVYNSWFGMLPFAFKTLLTRQK